MHGAVCVGDLCRQRYRVHVRRLELLRHRYGAELHRNVWNRRDGARARWVPGRVRLQFVLHDGWLPRVHVGRPAVHRRRVGPGRQRCRRDAMPCVHAGDSQCLERHLRQPERRDDRLPLKTQMESVRSGKVAIDRREQRAPPLI